MSRPIVVRADWDQDAGVWVATSADLPALVTESETLEALRAKVITMIAELLEIEGIATEAVPVDLIACVHKQPANTPSCPGSDPGTHCRRPTA